MWFGVAPPSPSRLTHKDVHPPLCSCALHRLERDKRLEAERQQALQSPRRLAGVLHSSAVHSPTAPLSSRLRGTASDKTTVTPRRHVHVQKTKMHGRNGDSTGRVKDEWSKKQTAREADGDVKSHHLQPEQGDEANAEVHENGQEIVQLMKELRIGGRVVQNQRSSKESELRTPGAAVVGVETQAGVFKSSSTSPANQADVGSGHLPMTPQVSFRSRRPSIHRAILTPPAGTDSSESSNNNVSEWSTTPAPFVSLRPEHLVGHTSSVCALVAHDDRFIVSCSVDGSVKVWSQVTFQCLHTVYGHGDVVSCVDLNVRWLVSGSHDCTLRLYDCTSSNFDLLHILRGHSGHVTHVRLPTSLPLHIVSCSDDYTLCLWNAELGQRILELRAHHSRVTCFDVQSDRICSGAADGSICFWDINALSSSPEQLPSQYISCARIYYAHKSTVQCIVDMSCSKSTSSISTVRTNSELCSVVVSGSNDGTIQLFSAKTFAHLGRLDIVGSPVYAMAALSNGRLLCSTKDGRLLLYGNVFRPTCRKAPAILQLATKWISSLQVCGDLVACSSEEVLYVVDTARMCMVLVFETQHSFVTCTRWIHRNALITAGQDNVIKQWTID